MNIPFTFAQTLTFVISIYAYLPTGADPDLDALVSKKLEDERTRIIKNSERREARERAKYRHSNVGAAGSPPASVAGSPGPSDADTTTVTPQKAGRGGRNKDGTARKCANCGQVGHIKTNRKSVQLPFTCSLCHGNEIVEGWTPPVEETAAVQQRVQKGKGKKRGAPEGLVEGQQQPPMKKKRGGAAAGKKDDEGAPAPSGAAAEFAKGTYSAFVL